MSTAKRRAKLAAALAAENVSAEHSKNIMDAFEADLARQEQERGAQMRAAEQELQRKALAYDKKAGN